MLYRRIRDKYEAELREIELSERNTQERYNELKSKLADAEGESFRVGGMLKQKEQEVEDIKKVSGIIVTCRIVAEWHTYLFALFFCIQKF